MSLEDDQQLHWKRRLVVDALERIAGLHSPEVEPVRRVSATLGYRNKVEFGLGCGVIGLVHREPSRGIVDVPTCPVQHATANRVLATARDFLLTDGGMTTDSFRFALDHIRIRHAVRSQTLLELFSSDEILGKSNYSVCP